MRTHSTHWKRPRHAFKAGDRVTDGEYHATVVFAHPFSQSIRVAYTDGPYSAGHPHVVDSGHFVFTS